MYNLMVHKIANDKDIRFPNGVFRRSVDEVRQRTPIKKTTKATKNVWTYIICRL